MARMQRAQQQALRKEFEVLNMKSNDLDTLSIDVLQSSLLVHEQRMNGHVVEEQALKETETKAYYAEASEEMLLMACVDVEEASKEELWFLDSCCSNHMCGKKELFSRLDEIFSTSVKLGDNSSMVVIGKGNTRMLVNGIMQVITEVFYVSGLKNNLPSVGQLQEKRLTILIQLGKCKIYHPERGLIMVTTMSSNRMFILPTQK
ncbi:uncharacterized protein LOC116118764 [Pistacia vera]|uniref:uncharacterized protein LOC116118764 n=1 Tax=Pistacia vera TaxID=55513 RepID=UPI0012639576|nr:uncharacterized protein LOC116118764 [Pistacia vera]